MESVELSSLRHIHLQHLHCQLLVLHPYKHLPRGDVPHGGDGHPQTPHHLRHHRLAPGQACHNCQAGHVRGKGAGRGQLDRDGWVGWCDLCGSRWRTGTGPSWSFRYCSQDASRGQLLSSLSSAGQQLAPRHTVCIFQLYICPQPAPF